jgi:hypothetical protein
MNTEVISIKMSPSWLPFFELVPLVSIYVKSFFGKACSGQDVVRSCRSTTGSSQR